MGRVWLGTPQRTSTGSTDRPKGDTPRPLDQLDIAAIARLAQPLRAQPAQQHAQRDGGRPSSWWLRLFQR